MGGRPRAPGAGLYFAEALKDALRGLPDADALYRRHDRRHPKPYLGVHEMGSHGPRCWRFVEVKGAGA